MPAHIFDTGLADLGISVFDLETTGLFPHRHRIIQVAVVQIDGAAIRGDGWMQLINPGADHLPLADIVVELTGISDARLAGQPGEEAVMTEMRDRVGDRVVAGHNVANFDLKFVRRAEQRHGIDIQTDYYLDTLKIMRKLHRGLDGYKLKDCATFYGLEFDESALHDALVDTTLTAEVLLKQLGDLDREGVKTFADLLDFLD